MQQAPSGHLTRSETVPDASTEPDGSRRRMRGLLILAGVLAAAALMPTFDPATGRFSFPNLKAIARPDMTGVLRFLLAYPLIAAVAVAAVAAWLRGSAGSLVLMALGGVYLVIVGLDSNHLTERMQLAGIGQRLSGWSLDGLSLVALIGMGGMFAGSRAQSFRPASRAAWLVGAIGSSAWLAAIALAAVLHGRDSFVWQLGQMISQPRHAWFATSVLAGLACTAGSAFFCLSSAPRPGARPDRAGRSTSRIYAQQAFFLLEVAILFLGGALLVWAAQTRARDLMGDPGELYSAIASVVKFGLSALLIALLVPIGLADLLIGLSGKTTGPVR